MRILVLFESAKVVVHHALAHFDEKRLIMLDSQKTPRASLFSIFAMIFRISAFTLGGGPVLIGLIKEAAEGTGLVTEERTSDMLALSLAAPGALGISMAYQAGLALGGPAGAVAGVLGMALPPFIAILVLSSWLLANMGSPYITAFFNGATAGLVIVLGLVVWNLTRKNALKAVKDTVLCLAVTVSVLVLKLSPVWGLIGGTVVGVCMNLIFENKEKKA